MARLVLHIGTGKTGTSFLQHCLFSNADKLAAQNWVVPQFGSSDSHLEIALALLDDPNNISVPSAPGLSTLYARQQSLGELAELLTEQVTPDSTWLISSEYFQAALIRPDQAVQCEQFFRRWFSEIDVIVYLRRQDYAIPSLYTEAVKTLVPDRSVDQLDWDFITRHWIDLFHLGTVRRWGKAFGPEHIIARPYQEQWRRSPQELFNDFVAATGMPHVDADTASMEARNAALSAEGVAFLMWIYPELNARVLRRRTVPDSDLGNDEIGQVLRSFVVPDGADGVRFQVARFTQAVAAATTGEALRLTPVQVEQILVRYSVVNDDLVAIQPDQAHWQQWLGQPTPPTSNGPVVLSDERAREIMQSLKGRKRSLRDSRLARRIRRRFR